MTSEERNQIRLMTNRPLGSIWSYWPFVLPVILVVLGVAIHVAVLWYLKHRYGDIDILIRHGKDVRLLWDSQLVQQAVLTTTFSIIFTFAFLAFLAYRLHKQTALLKAAAKDLGIEGGPHDGASNKNQHAPAK